MSLSADDIADVDLILTEARNGPFPSVTRGQRAYVMLCRSRGWDGAKAREIHDAWFPVISTEMEDDIPF